MTNDFYLTLHSNASMNMYPDNMLAHYITDLPQRIDLTGEWECGLAEIQYPHTWYNIGVDDSWFFLNEHEPMGQIPSAKISAGYYKGPVTQQSTSSSSRHDMLRALSVSGSHGATVCDRFTKIHYVPVLYSHFHSIEMDIRNDTGRRVPFEYGRVTVTLHFRWRKTGLF